MRPITALAFAFMVVSAGLILLSNFAVGLAFAVIALGLVAFSTMQKAGQARAELSPDDFDAETRSKYLPVHRLLEEVRTLAAAETSSDTARVIGQEALGEVASLEKHLLRAMAARSELKHSLRGRPEASREVEDLQGKLAGAASEEEKGAFSAALQARQMELEEYGRAESAVGKIDQDLEQTKLVLTTLKARLAMAGSQASTGAAEDVDELRQSLSRMRELSSSFDEAQRALGDAT